MGFIMKITRGHRRLRIALWAVGAVPGIAFPSIAQADFFDFLFPPPAVQATHPSIAGPGHRFPHGGNGPGFRRRVGHAIHGREQVGHVFHGHEHKFAVRRKLLHADKTDHEVVGPQAPVDLMDDDSLRHGDAVMTQTGIEIFVGHSSDHHRPEDFRKISEIKKLSKRERSAFAALDASNLNNGGQTSSNPGAVTGRSASENQLTAGETITDPNGRTIRYVGP